MTRAKGFSRAVAFGASVSLLCAGTLVCLTEAKGTYYRHPLPISYGNRYNLYTSGSSPQLTPEKPLARHKIYCAYVVQRNVTCTLQDGVESYVKAEYHKCSWGPKCPGKVVENFGISSCWGEINLPSLPVCKCDHVCYLRAYAGPSVHVESIKN